MSAPAERPAQAAVAGPASERVRLRRKRERGSYDRALIDAILDEALIAHLGIVDEDGQPFVIPTLHARCGDVVYCHGSNASRTLRAMEAGAPACLTVSLIDGLVLARSAMHHSANYRSAMLLGRARLVQEREEKRAALRAIVEHIVPGRWSDVRAPTENEMKATAVLALAIEEASAKVRTRPAAGRRGGLRAGRVGGRDPAGQPPAGPGARPAPARGHPAARVRERLPAPGRPSPQ